MKKILSILLTLSLLFGLTTPILASDEIGVTVNDQKITFTEYPVMDNDRILVPIRAIAESMQFEVNWEQSTQKITLENFNTILTLFVNQNTIEKNLKLASDEYKDKISIIGIDVPAKIIDERTYIPLRAISELFGANVEWEQSTSTANITYNLLYGEPVTFKDKGIEYLCRLAIALDGIDTSDIYNLSSDTRDKIYDQGIGFYEGTIYDGVLKNITSLGVNREYSSDFNIVNSLEDISKFPNLKNLYLLAQNITDLSPITYKKNWDEIDVYQNPIFDFSSLQNIQVNHFVYVGYYEYLFSYINNDFNPGSTLSESEKEKYNLFTTNLNKIFGTMQKVIKDNITPDMTRSEKIEVINNWIIQNIQYDTDSNFFNNIPTFYTTVDQNYYSDYCNQLECAIIHGNAICAGYSIVFGVFCDMLEIPCIKIQGKGYNETLPIKHEWNVVQLEDGNLYHVDTTWNCSNNIYLLLSDEEISEDHEWNSEDIPLIFKAKKMNCTFFDYNN